MIKLLYFLILSFLHNFIGLGQSIQVNPDGTHSTVFHNGNISTIVNPDGTHSTVFHNGNISTIVNPDGTHSTVFHNGNISTIVNPDSTNSRVINNRSKSTLFKPKNKLSIKDSTANSFGLRDSIKINIGDTISNSIPAKNQN